MGMPLIDGIRQMAMTATDPHSHGRNFPGHYSRREWNVIPVSSVIEIQYAMAPGTALVQKRLGGTAITIAVGGDAGTAEGDFASCLIWSSRPNNELPVLMIVMNNGWGISTPASSQHAEHNIIDRGKAFGIPGAVVDGNDPVASWFAVERAMTFCRTQRRPYMLEARVSRLHGHSSSSGAARNTVEPDCLVLFERQLLEAGVADPMAVAHMRKEAYDEADRAADQVVHEKRPTPDEVYKFTFAPSKVDAVYLNDYTGLPPRA
jgi:2-oxoisovalerate dehydrogenase E1 component alpha subunit